MMALHVSSAAAPVIVVGAGLSGLATALGAALHGRRVVIFEAADLVGGAAAIHRATVPQADSASDDDHSTSAA